jgi:hypothetical protein
MILKGMPIVDCPAGSMNLYLIDVAEDWSGREVDGARIRSEVFDRAVVYAESPDEALEKITAFIVLANEANQDNPVWHDWQIMEPTVVRLADGVTPPDDPGLYDANDILIFGTNFPDED